MHLEQALERLQSIIGEIENKQLPLHEIMKLHEEGKKLISTSENLLQEAKGKLKVTEVGIDSEPDHVETSHSQNSDSTDYGEISLF